MPDERALARSRILHAALKEFGLHGFRGARIDVIARRAGVPRGLIAYYFGTKEGLFHALARERAESIERLQSNIGREDPFGWTLSLFAQGETAFDWVRLLIWEGLDWDTPETEMPEAGSRRKFWEDRIAAVGQYQASGKLPATVSTEYMTLCLYVLGIYPYLMPQIVYLITGRWPSDEKFQVDFEQFVRGLADKITGEAAVPRGSPSRTSRSQP